MKNIELDIYEILRLIQQLRNQRKVSVKLIRNHLVYRIPFIASELSDKIIKEIIIKIIPISFNKKKNKKYFVISKKYLIQYKKTKSQNIRPFRDVKREYFNV